MRFITNIEDPNGPRAKSNVIRRSDQTYKEAREKYLEWLSDKVIGEPVGSEKGLTTEALKEMGMVGVYSKSDEV